MKKNYLQPTFEAVLFDAPESDVLKTSDALSSTEQSVSMSDFDSGMFS